LDRYVLYRADEKCSDLGIKRDVLKSKMGHLESNFDRQILKMINEVVAWKKLLTI
jgi:dynein heavy chain